MKGHIERPQDVRSKRVQPNSGSSASGRPVITLTPTAPIGGETPVSQNTSRAGVPSIPSISLPDGDYISDESNSYGKPNVRINDADYVPPSPNNRDSRQASGIDASNTTTFSSAIHRRSRSGSSYNTQTSPQNSKRSLPPPPIHRQKSSANVDIQRGRIRAGGLVCGGCELDIAGRIVSAMAADGILSVSSVRIVASCLSMFLLTSMMDCRIVISIIMRHAFRFFIVTFSLSQYTSALCSKMLPLQNSNNRRALYHPRRSGSWKTSVS